MLKRSVIITAGGIGKRLANDIPKQFLMLGDLPILAHSIKAFYEFDQTIQVIVTLPKEWITYWESKVKEIKFEVPHQTVVGGEERFHSIRNALSYTNGEQIAIHDGVRPFVSKETISRCFAGLTTFKAVVPVLPLKDSIRIINDKESEASNRLNFRLVHTPQCFHAEVLYLAYQQVYAANITDDATLVEQMGESIHLVESNQENIKITTPSDLLFAQFIINCL
jgi:2-C-methyl-D-erythritol 4-phosphate cytidylyltransferase